MADSSGRPTRRRDSVRSLAEGMYPGGPDRPVMRAGSGEDSPGNYIPGPMQGPPMPPSAPARRRPPARRSAADNSADELNARELERVRKEYGSANFKKGGMVKAPKPLTKGAAAPVPPMRANAPSAAAGKKAPPMGKKPMPFKKGGRVKC